MNCSFKTVEDGVHQCIYCGKIVRLQIDPNKLMSPCTKDVAQPNILEKAASFVQAIVEYAQDDFTDVSNEEHARRMDLCNKCENFENGTCRLCGCSCNFKSKMRAMKCPINKW